MSASRYRMVLEGVLGAAILLYLALLGYNSVRMDGRFTPDSIIYIDAARNVVEGRGLSRSMVLLPRLIDAEAGLPQPIVQWAPGFPLGIAAVHAAGVPAPKAALILPVVFLAVLLAVVYFVVRAQFGISAALVTVALALHFRPLAFVATHGWSETMGLVFSFAAIGAAWSASRIEGTRPFPWVLLAGVLTGLAIATRFALLPLAGLVVLLVVSRARPRESVYRVLALTAGIAVTAGPVFLRNALQSGRWAGPPAGTAASTIRQGLRDAWFAGIESFVIENIYARIVVVMLGCAVPVFAGLRLVHRELVPVLKRVFVDDRRWWLLVWPLLYVVFLVVAQSRMYVDPIGLRLLIPATLTLSIAGIALAVAISKPPSPVVWALALALVVLAVVPQARRARVLADPRVEHAYDIERNVARSPLLTWLSENATREDLLIAEEGLDIPFFLGPVDTAFFSPLYTPGWRLDYEELMDWLQNGGNCTKYRQILLIARPKDTDSARIEQDHGPFAANLVLRRAHMYLALRHLATVDDGIIYRVRCEP